MLVVAGGKHSPGTTTLAHTIATVAGAGLLVEADPSGGDLAVRNGLAVDPGLASLTVAARTGLDHQHLRDHVQTLPSGVEVLVSSVAVRHATSTIATIAGPLAALLHADDAELTVVDVGRVDNADIVGPFLTVADRVLFVTGSGADDAASARSRVDMLRDHNRFVTVVVTGRDGFGLGAISAALAVPDMVRVPWDPRAAARVNTGRALDRWTTRSAYVRAVAHLTRHLTSGSTRDSDGEISLAAPCAFGDRQVDTTLDAPMKARRAG
jgi:hypothetical protein